MGEKLFAKRSTFGGQQTHETKCELPSTYTVPGWEIDPVEFNTHHKAGISWFYLLVLDDKNQVWARTMSSSVLDKNEPGFVACVKHSLAMNTGAKETARDVYYFPKKGVTKI